MLATETTIKEMYETLGMSPEQIAQETPYDIEAIRLSLLKNSSQYKKSLGGTDIATRGDGINDNLPFKEDQEEISKKILLELAQYGECELVRASCARTIIRVNQEERKSKRLTQIGRTNFNIVLVQQQLEKAKLASSQNPQKDIIELEVASS